MKNILTIFLLLICGLCFGQNLVPNPSFENNSGCPFLINDITHFANNWVVYDPTPDYFNTCSTEPGLGVPANHAGWQYPASGDAYCGGFVYIEPGVGPVNNREAIGTQLITPMVVGQKYYVSLKVSLANSSRYSINNVGLLFTSRPYCEIYNPPPSNCTSPSVPISTPNFAHVYTSTVISDTLNWTTITGTLVADSAYSYVAWGNFFSDSLTIAIDRGGIGHLTYFYVDDVCVSSDFLTCNSSVGIRQTERSDNVSVFPNPFSTQLIFSLMDNEQTTISLYDFLGQQVLQQTFTNSKTINTEQLADGIYFYELRNSKGILKTGKVFKQ